MINFVEHTKQFIRDKGWEREYYNGNIYIVSSESIISRQIWICDSDTIPAISIYGFYNKKSPFYAEHRHGMQMNCTNSYCRNFFISKQKVYGKNIEYFDVS